MSRELPFVVEEAWIYCLPIWLNSPWSDERWAHGGRVYFFGRPEQHARLVQELQSR